VEERIRISRANPEACEYLDILHLKWKAIDPPIEEQPHEACLIWSRAQTRFQTRFAMVKFLT
jgi:hypothetical protein